MSKAVMQQALEALERTDAEPGTLAWERENEAMEALRAALAEQKCPCGDRPADQCPGEWEPGCDLGANEKYAKVAEQPHPVAWMVKDEGLYWTEEAAIRRANQFVEPLDVVALYTTPPAPQSLRDLCAAAYQVVGVADGPVEMLDNLWAAAEGKPLPHDPGAGLPWSPPSPQPLTELPPLPEPAGKLYSYNYTADQMRDYARAVEAEVLKRTGVQR